MDGMRAYWDGQRLLSRHGNEFNAPKEFTSNLPRGIILDGELWAGREKFQQLVALLNSNDEDWSRVEYHVFDFLSAPLVSYEGRMAKLNQLQLPVQVTNMLN